MPSIRSESLDPVRFEAFAAHLARKHEADMLVSPRNWPGETRSIIGLHPEEELLLEQDTPVQTVKDFAFAKAGPVLGFISYDYGLPLRGVSSTKRHPFPAGHLKRYGTTIAYDHACGTLVVTAPNARKAEGMLAMATQKHPSGERFSGFGTPVEPSMDRQRYEDGVRRTLDYIRQGWTYQLNLSIRFRRICPDLDPLALFLFMQQNYPAPFYGWINSGPYRVLSASPERFLKVDDGQVLSQPIKGTMEAASLDAALVKRLTGSPKEDAELSMIVDLIRNDISTECEYGSVRVPRHKSVFHVDRLLQMYSDVTGTLRKDRDCLDLFFSAFPGGSITGCPKTSSMRIIDELEPHARGVYCGSLVCIHGPRDMDSSIAIRTAVYDTHEGMLDTWAGSGIVVDSDPGGEYLETMAKAEKFLRERPVSG